MILSDLEKYIEVNWPRLHHRMHTDEYLTMEATFTSQVITLYIYDAPLEIATKIFEMFLVDGAQLIADLLVNLIEI
jgi:hypothetical protein